VIVRRWVDELSRPMIGDDDRGNMLAAEIGRAVRFKSAAPLDARLNRGVVILVPGDHHRDMARSRPDRGCLNPGHQLPDGLVAARDKPPSVPAVAALRHVRAGQAVHVIALVRNNMGVVGHPAALEVSTQPVKPDNFAGEIRICLNLPEAQKGVVLGTVELERLTGDRSLRIGKEDGL